MTAKDRLWARVKSDRGSVFLEYAMLSCLVTTVALAAFAPGSWVNWALGCDFKTRQFFIKFPFF